MADRDTSHNPHSAEGVGHELGARMGRCESALGSIAEHMRLQRIPLETMLTPAEVAKKLRVSAGTVKRWIENGELKASLLKAGKIKLYRIKPSDVEAFLSGVIEPTATANAPRRKLLEIPDIDV